MYLKAKSSYQEPPHSVLRLDKPTAIFLSGTSSYSILQLDNPTAIFITGTSSFPPLTRLRYPL